MHQHADHAEPHQTITHSAPRGAGAHRGLGIAAALLLLVTGCADASTEDPPSPSTSSAEDASPSAEPSTPSDSEDPQPTPSDTEQTEDQEPASMETSAPISFAIPAIDAGSELLHLGLREDNTLDVPPGAPGSPASWYTGSPTPGESGPSVLLGHVDDSIGEPGVFADLPDLVEGDEITVDREDGSTATFSVTKAEQYGKNDFPTLEVYGNTDQAELRLITCDGYNEETGEYEDNYVVYAALEE